MIVFILKLKTVQMHFKRIIVKQNKMHRKFNITLINEYFQPLRNKSFGNMYVWIYLKIKYNIGML